MQRYLLDRAGVDQLLSMFSRALAIRATFFDASDEELGLFDIADRSAYCTRLRQDPEMDARCLGCDRAALTQARSRREPYVYRCHRNLWEAVVPLYGPAGNYLGALLCGQIRPEQARQRQADAALQAEYARLPRMDAAQFGRVVDLLRFIGDGIIARGLIRMQEAAWVERLQDWVDQHLHERIDLARMASLVGRSPSWLSQQFRTQLGTSPGHWLISRRMRRAEQLLRQGLAVQTVAERLGFCDPYHFSKTYKRHTGRSPSNDLRQDRL